MSLFRSSLRPPAPISDEAIERYLAAIRAELDPDPLFRRRLRGHVVNRFVAAREGIATTRAAMPREMGRLGRAVLYGSFTLGISVTGAMAASQQAIPGDAFYPMKRQIEALRVQIVPAGLRDDLAAYTLGQRIDELARLAERGNWAAVAAHAEAVEAAYDALVASSSDPAALAGHLVIAGELLDHVPDHARTIVERTLAGDAPGLGSGAGGGGRPASPPSHGGGGGHQGAGGTEEPAAPDSPKASPAAEPRTPPSAPGRTGEDAPAVTPRPEPRGEPQGELPATKSPRPTKPPKPGSG